MKHKRIQISGFQIILFVKLIQFILVVNDRYIFPLKAEKITFLKLYNK
jgi:hypothetical protein